MATLFNTPKMGITRRGFIGVAGTGAVLAMGALSGTALAQEGPLFSAGTYTASAGGRNGDVTVTVTFSDGALTDIATEHEETPTIGGAAIESLTNEVLEAQALDLDAVAGATMSSEAFLAAVANCVEQAGADPAQLVGGAVKQAVDYVTEADVIIVGAGGAGLTAAVTAAEEGANVIVLEKSGVVGGNSLMTMNGINAVDSSIQLANDEYVAEAPEGGFKDLTLSMNESALADYPEAETTDEAMLDTYVANSGELIDWLVDKGMEFEVAFAEDPRNSTVNYWLLMGGGNFETAPKVINLLNEELKALSNVHLYLNTEVTSITTDEEGVVTGVVATTPDGEKDFSASSVVLCTGGFNANKAMIAKERPDLVNTVIGVRAPTTGDGLVMAEELGAATINLDVMNTFPNFMVDYGMVMAEMLPGGETIDCIYVDQDAKRFTAEGFMVANALLANEKSFVVFDESGMNDALQAALHAGVVQQADSIEELAEQLGIGGEALAATVEAFNEDMADGVDDEFGRQNGSVDPLEAPFYGYQFGVGTHYDLGGLVTNPSTQVLNEEGEIIPGLYAADEVVGSYQGTFRVDGSGIGESLVFGRVAGKKVAQATAA